MWIFEGPSLDLLAEVGAQCERTIVVQLLVASPTDGVTHSLYFDLGAKFQSLPIGDVWKNELGLPNFTRQGITGIQTTALEHLAVLSLHRHPQHSGHARNAVIGKADDQSQVAGSFVTPNERWTHAIANAATDAVERRRISLVVVHQIFGADLVKVPERPVIRADIDHVRDHIFCRRYAFLCEARIGRFARKPLLEQRRDPRRAIAERFDLFVLDEDGVTANPIVAADGAIQQF